MKRAFLLVVFSSVATTAATATPGELTAPVLEATLRNEGATATLKRHFDCTEAGNSTYDMVAKGSDSWLALAIRLLPEAQGCYSLNLRSSIAEAMSVRPAKVLELMKTIPSLGGHKVCLPFMSADEPANLHLAYLAKLEAALATVHTPRLQQARQVCLTEIHKAQHRLQ